MDNKELHAWSRHYDTMLWTVTGIFSAANSSLILYLYSRQSPVWPTYVLGIVLTLLTVYFAASFRSARQSIHNILPPAERTITRGSPELKQWLVFLAFFSLLLFFWIVLLIQNCPHLAVLWAGMGIAVVGIMYYVGFHKERTSQQTTPTHADEEDDEDS
jgi:hypothetical protein